MANLRRSTTEQATIALRIDGVFVGDDVSIDPSECSLIERTASSVRMLLHAFGGFEFDAIPQFANHRILLPVLPFNQEGLPFDSLIFDKFCRNIAEFIDADREGRAPLLDFPDRKAEFEAIARNLRSFGEVCFEVMKWREIRISKISTPETDAKLLATFEVESAAAASNLKHSDGKCIVDRNRVENLRPGDRILLDEMGEIERVNRAVGSLVRIINETDTVTGDLFQSAQDDEQDESEED